MPFSVESENGLTAHCAHADDPLEPTATLPMPSTLSREQEHWNELAGDPAFFVERPVVPCSVSRRS